MLDQTLRRYRLSSLAARSRLRILHLVSADTPPAHSALRDLALPNAGEGFEHIVIAVSQRTGAVRQDPPEDNDLWGASLRRSGSPGSWRRNASAREMAELVDQLLRGRGGPPDAVQAEDFGFDALVGGLLARRLAVPLVLSISAETALGGLFPLSSGLRRRRLLQEAKLLLLRPTWNIRTGWGASPHRAKAVNLPGIASNATQSIRPTPASRGFLTVTSLDRWRSSGLEDLLWALAIAVKRSGALRLDIMGSGSARATNSIRALVGQLGIAQHVSLMEPLEPRHLRKRLPEYLALVFPGGEEPFNMLPVEALFAGVPLLVTPRTDVLGLLRGISSGLSVDPADIEGASEALCGLYDRNDEYRAAISDEAQELYHRFGEWGVASNYRQAIQSVVFGVEDEASSHAPEVGMPEGAWAPGE